MCLSCFESRLACLYFNFVFVCFLNAFIIVFNQSQPLLVDLNFRFIDFALSIAATGEQCGDREYAYALFYFHFRILLEDYVIKAGW